MNAELQAPICIACRKPQYPPEGPCSHRQVCRDRRDRVQASRASRLDAKTPPFVRERHAFQYTVAPESGRIATVSDDDQIMIDLFESGEIWDESDPS